MKSVFARHLIVATALLWTAAAQALPEFDADAPYSADDEISFNRDIRPFFVKQVRYNMGPYKNIVLGSAPCE